MENLEEVKITLLGSRYTFIRVDNNSDIDDLKYFYNEILNCGRVIDFICIDETIDSMNIKQYLNVEMSYSSKLIPINLMKSCDIVMIYSNGFLKIIKNRHHNYNINFNLKNLIRIHKLNIILSI